MLQLARGHSTVHTNNIMKDIEMRLNSVSCKQKKSASRWLLQCYIVSSTSTQRSSCISQAGQRSLMDSKWADICITAILMSLMLHRHSFLYSKTSSKPACGQHVRGFFLKFSRGTSKAGIIWKEKNLASCHCVGKIPTLRYVMNDDHSFVSPSPVRK